jgi:hypothetical protein
MPIKLSDLQKRTRTIEVEYQGDVVNVTYLVNVITPAFLSEQPDAVVQIGAAVTAWDVLDDAGKPISPTEIANQLPLGFLSAVLEALTGDMRGALEKKG